MSGQQAGERPEGGRGGELERAEALELELRLRVAELVTERRRTTDEILRLEQRAQLPGADPAIGQAADRYRARLQTLEHELTDARARLRAQEGAVATLRAARDLGPPAPQPPGGDR
jgi:hypothetical protein